MAFLAARLLEGEVEKGLELFAECYLFVGSEHGGLAPGSNSLQARFGKPRA